MPLRLVRTVDPAVEPLTRDEAKAHCRIDADDTSQDAWLDGAIAAARAYLEARTRRAFLTQTWQLTLDAFPYGDRLPLPRPNLLAVTSLQYVDTDGVLQTWDAANYAVATDALPGEIQIAYGVYAWPIIRPQRGAVVITYTAGYGAEATKVPPTIRQAMQLLVGQWFENREVQAVGTVAATLEFTVDALIATEIVSELH